MSFFCESNVIAFAPRGMPTARRDPRPAPGTRLPVVAGRATPARQTAAPAIEPPDPNELNAARLYDLGMFSNDQFVRCCDGCQIRAGRALDKHLRSKP